MKDDWDEMLFNIDKLYGEKLAEAFEILIEEGKVEEVNFMYETLMPKTRV